MNPTAILPHSVNLILQYISPPSQLNKPLPPHLISNDLLQRHHFLQPETPDTYLCWPSIHQRHIISLLEAFRIDDDHRTTYPVRYSCDDRTYAHVAVTSGLRIVFQWDSIDGWKYHDAKLMPFPPGCSASLEHIDNPEPYSPEHDTKDDDSYWGAYGQDGDDQETSGILDSQKNDAQESPEDAYWAQYATVQGSGDSTLPSPLPHNPRKKQFAAAQVHAGLDEPLVFPRSVIYPGVCSHFEPPSPSTITAALSAISHEKSQSLSPSFLEFEPGSGSDLTMPSPFSEVTGSANSPTSARLVSGDHVASLSTAETGKRRPQECGSNGVHHEEPLRESIKGMYYLWKAGRRNNSHAGIDEAKDQREEKQLFLHVVRETVDSL